MSLFKNALELSRIYLEKERPSINSSNSLIGKYQNVSPSSSRGPLTKEVDNFHPKQICKDQTTANFILPWTKNGANIPISYRKSSLFFRQNDKTNAFPKKGFEIPATKKSKIEIPSSSNSLAKVFSRHVGPQGEIKFIDNAGEVHAGEVHPLVREQLWQKVEKQHLQDSESTPLKLRSRVFSKAFDLPSSSRCPSTSLSYHDSTNSCFGQKISREALRIQKRRLLNANRTSGNIESLRQEIRDPYRSLRMGSTSQTRVGHVKDHKESEDLFWKLQLLENRLNNTSRFAMSVKGARDTLPLSARTSSESKLKMRSKIEHIKAMRMANSSFCTICNKGRNLFHCDKCGRGFSDRGTLKSHSRTHTGEKPFQCLQCNRRFTQKGNLNRHAKIHIREMNLHQKLFGTLRRRADTLRAETNATSFADLSSSSKELEKEARVRNYMIDVQHESKILEGSQQLESIHRRRKRVPSWTRIPPASFRVPRRQRYTV